MSASRGEQAEHRGILPERVGVKRPVLPLAKKTGYQGSQFGAGPPRTPSASFIDLGAVNDCAADAALKIIINDAIPRTGIELRIELGGGMVLTIVRH